MSPAWFLALCLGALRATSALRTSSRRSKKPNVIVFVMDDVGWADVSYNTDGHNFPTPSIDRLTSEGVRLQHFYVSPQCSPTRSGLMTGRYTHRTGTAHWNTMLYGSEAGLPDDAVTLADQFREAGYQTHVVGKWHLGYSRPEQLPPGKGFDTWFGTTGGRLEFYNHTTLTGPLFFANGRNGAESPWGDGEAIDLWEMKNASHLEAVPPKSWPPTDADYSEDLYSERALRIFQAHASGDAPKPFFIYFTPNLLHEPIDAPPGPPRSQCASVLSGPYPDGEPHNRTALCTMMVRLDEHFEKMEAQLQELGLWEDTLIFALSDNGGMTMYNNQIPAAASCNWPLRGGKTTLFQGGVRVPAFIVGGAVPAGARSKVINMPMHVTDVYPTLSHFAGLSAPDYAVDGVDQWSKIVGTEPTGTPREIVLNIGVNPMGGWPAAMMGPAPRGDLNYSSIISWPQKLIFADTYVGAGGAIGGEVYPRSGYYSCGADGYVYHAEEGPQLAVGLDVPNNWFTYPRMHGKTVGAYLFNLELDPNERSNLLQGGGHKEEALQLLARLEHHARPINGWQEDQWNFPKQNANPACHNWQFMPGPWNWSSCLAARISEVPAEEWEQQVSYMGRFGGALF